MTDLPSWFFPAVVVAYFVGAAVVTMVDRQRRGKPIWPSDPPSPLFKERFASGRSHRTWFSRIGGARNALVVMVTSRELIVRPLLPAMLVFRLPELTGLEHTVPARRIQGVDANGGAVDVEFENDSGQLETLTLQLDGQEEFVRALSTIRRRTGV